MRISHGIAATVAAVALATLPSSAAAQGIEDVSNQWLPRSDGAEWTYAWSNSAYSPAPRTERYHLQARNAATFRLRWEEVDPPESESPSAGTLDFQHTDAGLVNLNYQSTPPPRSFPILCASASQCANSVAGAFYMVIWGSRSPTLAEPLLRGSSWTSQGGAADDVASNNRYTGRERVTVPAFPEGIEAAKVESRITQAGAIGDPFGSGVRTVWWVRGVGPVKVEMRHGGGELSSAELRNTNLSPLPPPSDVNLFPVTAGKRATFRWRNSRHMPRWSRQRFEVVQVVNNTARVDVRHLTGPIAVAGTYLFSTRLNGVRLLAGSTKAQSRVRFPALGPRSAPSAERARFFTPYDLMVFGFGPIVPIGATPGTTWRSSREGPDWTVFGVSGVSKVIGERTVRTRAGSFRATVVQSDLKQAGFRFGSGRRISYFAAGRGLVKLVFRHSDGSVSTVERER